MTLSYNILSDYIVEGDNVIVAVSGGADSMCLLDLIHQYSKKVEFNFCVVHVNHNIRNEESDRDQRFVEEYCAKNSIKCKTFAVKAVNFAKKHGQTLEQAARELRYGAIYNYKSEINANKIFVAHHMTDQAETVLMHIARGASLKGAKGMSPVGELFRPLLSFSKEQILKYVQKNDIPFVNDSTNDDCLYARNFVRKEVLPKLEKVYPKVKQALCQFADKCRIDDDFIESMLPYDLLKIENKGAKILKGIEEKHPALSLRIIKKAFEFIGVMSDIEQKHLIKVLELFEKRAGATLNLPHQVKAYKEYDGVFLIKENRDRKEIYQPFELSNFNFDGFGKVFLQKIDKNADFKYEKGCHYIDLDKIPQNAVWRTIKAGDFFKKYGGGTKKLADYFTDKKIVKRKRDLIPVLATDKTILLVAGMDISDQLKITEETKRIIKISYQNAQ